MIIFNQNVDRNKEAKETKEELFMSMVDEITREKWILGAFPEWGTWLNEEIEEEVKPDTVAMQFKTENNTNISIDLWFGNDKRTKKVKEMKPFHQMRNMTAGRMTQPNLREDVWPTEKTSVVIATEEDLKIALRMNQTFHSVQFFNNRIEDNSYVN